jgi:hypothetical protein
MDGSPCKLITSLASLSILLAAPPLTMGHAASVISGRGLDGYTAISHVAHLHSLRSPSNFTNGTVPDLSPQPYANGSCVTYTTQKNDSCPAIAQVNHMTTSKIEVVNSGTWGWMGCNSFQAGQRICLSEGSPPFPAPLQGAMCGPQVSD